MGVVNPKCNWMWGEVKFQSFNDWSFDYCLQVLDTKWRESKKVKIITMPRVAGDTFGTDFYWAHGAYAMCENGLFRRTGWRMLCSQACTTVAMMEYQH